MGRKLIDMIGQKFGRWTVIKRNLPNNKWGESNWLCRCECGTEKIIPGSNLRDGTTKSCGCLKRELLGNRRRLALGLANMRMLIGNYKWNAKERDQSFTLTEEQFKKLTQQDCHYCGAKPNNVINQEGNFGEYIYNGLDRIDSNKGYVMDNVVPCCKICNSAKSNLTLQEYKSWIKRSYNKMFR